MRRRKITWFNPPPPPLFFSNIIVATNVAKIFLTLIYKKKLSKGQKVKQNLR